MENRLSSGFRLRLGVVAMLTAALCGTTFAAASATEAASPGRDFSIVASAATSATASMTASTGARMSAAYSQTAYVRVSDALLRSRPSIYSTKLDVSQPWRKVTVYCWHDYTDNVHLIWFRVHPWGSRYSGYMRADTLLRTGPLPPRC